MSAFNLRSHGITVERVRTIPHPVFGVGVVAECPGVPQEVLGPRDTWADKAAYDATAKKLAQLFIANFKAYESGASAEVRAASPFA
jgi:phosphoenolpyruvate carboxykinase (ATP)